MKVLIPTINVFIAPWQKSSHTFAAFQAHFIWNANGKIAARKTIYHNDIS